jgi:hypothetical protein
VSSDQEIPLNAVLDWLEKGHITTTQAAARIDPENRQVMRFACKFRRQRAYAARHPAADSPPDPAPPTELDRPRCRKI